MSTNALFLLLILLACPLMMVFMMKGMHGGSQGSSGHGHAHGGDHNSPAGDELDRTASLDDLRRQRDSLDREIDEREAREKSGSAT